jgi:hypothetical protein
MTVKLEDDLDSLSFSAVKRLIERICKSLGFKFSHEPFYGPPVWLLYIDKYNIVFLDRHDRGDCKTAKDLLKGILAAKTFLLRSLATHEDKTIPNPFYSLDLCALKIKLDLLA